jgi:ABC-2 type transport system ATP-binding protein
MTQVTQPRTSLPTPAGSPAPESLVTFSDLTVRYDAFTLGPVSFELRAGEVFCLVGPNGSGKTTLLNALLGLVPVAGGHASLRGRPAAGRPPDVLRHIGFVSDDGAELVPELTAQELWELHAWAHARAGGPRVDVSLAHARRLAARLDFAIPSSSISAHSHGMRKKTQVVAALLHEPDLLVLDEPHDGLDPIAIRRLDDLVAELARSGRTVLLATHDLHFAGRLADRVGVLYQGRLLAVAPPDAVVAPGEDGFADAFFRILSEAPEPAP